MASPVLLMLSHDPFGRDIDYSAKSEMKSQRRAMTAPPYSWSRTCDSYAARIQRALVTVVAQMQILLRKS